MSGIPDWLDRREYPFVLRNFSSSAGRLNYIDEGSGPVVLFLHGNPTWSFLYRKIIITLGRNFRCIAPDYLGFGLSESPENFSYSPESHGAIITEFIESQIPNTFSLVLHDWGGPIGLEYATKHPLQIRRIVLCNTWMWPVKHLLKFWLFSSVLGNRGMLPLYYRANLFGRYVMPFGFAHPCSIPPGIHEQYLQSQSSRKSKYATWAFPRALLSSGDMLSNLWKSRELLGHIPKLLVWGLKDRMFTKVSLSIWMNAFPEVKVIPVEDAGHYVPEEIETTQIKNIAQFLKK